MATTNPPFGLPPIPQMDGVPLSMPFATHEWAAPAPPNDMGIKNVQAASSASHFDQVHGMDTNINPGLLSAMHNAPQPMPLGAPHMAASNVLPMHMALGTPNADSPNVETHGLAARPNPHAEPVAPSYRAHDLAQTSSQLQEGSHANLLHASGGLHIGFDEAAETATAHERQHLAKIGDLLDELASTAADARVLFHGGRYDKCSGSVMEIKAQLHAIGELGVESMRSAARFAPHAQRPHEDTNRPQAFDVHAGVQPLNTWSPQEEQQVRSAALFSVLSTSPGRRKRPMAAEAVPDLPAKSLRGVHPIYLPSDQPKRASPSDPGQPIFSAVNSPLFGFHAMQAQPQSVLSTPGVGAHTPFFSDTPGILNAEEPAPTPTALLSAMDTPSETPTPGSTAPYVPTPSEPLSMSADPMQLALDQSTWGEPAQDAGADEPWDAPTPDKNGGADLSTELRQRLDTIFHEFLNSLCSNLDAADDRGEPIHQTLMPKKMARLDESTDFRPFKFRIQAFTNAFQADLASKGVTETVCSIKKIKQYLWSQPYISRFNEDGKKAKSKGNHIWNIEAKKVPEGGWIFRSFSPKIAGASNRVAYVGERWTWNLRIWDPQSSSSSIKVVYSANTLPSWIYWEDNEKVLTGIPQSTAQSGDVSVTALYVHLGELHRLEHSFYLQVLEQDERTQAAPAADDAPPARVPSAVDPAPAQGSGMLPMPIASTSMPAGQSLDRESIKYEVVDPSKVPTVLSSVAFPFTPPVYVDKRLQHLGMDPAVLSPSPDAIAANHARNRNTGFFPAGAPAVSTPTPMNQTAVFIQNPGLDTAGTPTATAALPLPQQMVAQDPLGAPQLLNMIEQRQQNQVASLMLSIPERPPAFTLNEHPGQGTPMSNLPQDMSATLPPLPPLPER